MSEKEVYVLEKAAFNLLAPPDVVTPEERHEAENVFLSLRKSQLPYNFCKHILESCNNDYVLFQAAATIKESIVREWKLLAASDVEMLRSFLLHYVTSNVNLQNYVKEQVLQAVAVIFKRASFDPNAGNKESLFTDVEKLIDSRDLTLQLIACSIITSLLNEFSSTNKTSSVGLTWEFHHKCKRKFEQEDLQRVFCFCLQVLYELEKAPPPLSRETIALLNRILAILEQILCWEFIPRGLPRRIVGAFMNNQNVSFKPPKSWMNLILEEHFLHTMLKIHKKVCFNSEISHHSLQCLSQLATLNGPCIVDKQSETQFLCRFINIFLELTDGELHDYEALGFASIVSNLTIFFPIESFLELEENLLERFLSAMTLLTCQFGQASALEDVVHKDDTLYLEAYEKMLDAWMILVTSTCHLPKSSLHSNALQIFKSYLQCHLASPDGTRNQGLDCSSNSDEQEYDEIEEDDRDKFEDQLTCIGNLGRLVPHETIPLLVRLLEDRLSRLHSHLQNVSSEHLGSIQDVAVMNSLNEDLHWLLLVSGNILCEKVEGETPMIPSAIMNYCIKQTQHINIETSLKVLSSPSVKVQDIIGAEQTTDLVIRLVSCAFRLCEIENSILIVKKDILLSPQVGSSLMWFLKRWVESYLLPNEEQYSELSRALMTAFGQDSEGGMWTVSYIMNKIVTNLRMWNSEVDLINDTLELLFCLVNKRQRTAVVVNCPDFWKLAKEAAANVAPYNALPPVSKRLLSRALVTAGSTSFNGNFSTNEEYWQLIIISVNERLQNVFNRKDLRKNCEQVKEEILCLLESLIGIVQACLCTNAKVIFNLLHPIMFQSIHLLEIYKDSQDVIMLILELYKESTNNILVYLEQADSNKLYDCCLQVVQVYARHNLGRRMKNKYEEEEQFEDLCLLLEMLNNLTSKEFIDFSFNDSSEAPDDSVEVNVEDVVLYALHNVIPLMTPELLKYPALCTNYTRLLTYLAESHPEKISALPDDFVQKILATLEYELTNLNSDIVKLCLEFLNFVCCDLCKRSIKTGCMYVSMAHFLQLVFKMLIVDTFDIELCDTACSAFFSLICCHQEQYKSLVNELLQQHPDNCQRLLEAFNKLTPPNMQLTISRATHIQFLSNFEHFLTDIRGFLCVR